MDGGGGVQHVLFIGAWRKVEAVCMRSGGTGIVFRGIEKDPWGVGSGVRMERAGRGEGRGWGKEGLGAGNFGAGEFGCGGGGGGAHAPP